MIPDYIKLSRGGIKFFQLFILLFSSLLALFNVLFVWSEPTKNMIVVTLISTAGLVTLNLLYAKIYDVKIENHEIIIENLYAKVEFCGEDLTAIKGVHPIPFLYKVVIGKRNYFFFGNLALALKEFTASTAEALEAITTQFKKRKRK
ncbi:hypothetical protein D1627_10410 [Pontibacter oryzae]|uniref:Uncharacterized protein n=2 Tax=Pontibacter oryzae TaxID=2304593 RepID=A0A399S2L1_9BACT|nr:hypothetical protein D1627_10410 [Pontibacter oryzae]